MTAGLAKYASLSLVSLLFTTCVPEKSPNDLQDYSVGAFVVNEGKFGSNTGSVSYYDPVNKILENDLFFRVNHRPLGDVVQSMTVAGDTGFIVVNGSNKIELVNLHTFESVGTITGIDYPRYFFHAGGHTGLVTAGNYQGNLVKVDLESLSIIDQLPVGNGPENMVARDGKMYVANSGGWAYDSTLTVIDLAGFSVEDTLVVGDQPVDLAFDAMGDLWVLCSGKVIWNSSWTEILSETSSQLTCIHLDDFSTETYLIGHTGDYYNPRRLAMHPLEEKLYFDEVDGVYAMDITSDHSPGTAFIRKVPYGLEMDGFYTLYLLVPRGFDANGTLFLYREDGIAIDSMEVGIAPNGASFSHLLQVNWDRQF